MDRFRRRTWMLLVSVCLPALGGCGCYELAYVTSAALGHVNLLGQAIPIQAALEDPALSDEQHEKLALVILARDYAAEVVGLNVGQSYQEFVNLGDGSLAWNLSASPKDKIEPYTWHLPFVGPISYLGYFDFDEATAERDRLVASRYDTLIYEVDAYSTIGLLPDPVTSALLSREKPSLVDTVFHELLHNTVYSLNNTVFDESLASFVGRTAALEFLADEFGPDDPVVRDAIEGYEDGDKLNRFLSDLRTELEAVYASDLSYDEKLAAREPIFEAARQRVTEELLPSLHHPERYEQYATFNFNNAFLLVNGRYNTDGDLFERIYDLTGRNWPEVLAIFRDAAATTDPVGYLRTLLEPN